MVHLVVVAAARLVAVAVVRLVVVVVRMAADLVTDAQTVRKLAVMDDGVLPMLLVLLLVLICCS